SDSSPRPPGKIAFRKCGCSHIRSVPRRRGAAACLSSLARIVIEHARRFALPSVGKRKSEQGAVNGRTLLTGMVLLKIKRIANILYNRDAFMATFMLWK